MTIFQMADTSERGSGTCHVFFLTHLGSSVQYVLKNISVFSMLLFEGCVELYGLLLGANYSKVLRMMAITVVQALYLAYC